MERQDQRNEFTTDKYRKAFLETANAFHGNSHPFHPFPKAVDRKAYEGLPAALKELLIQAGEAKLGYEFPVIRATDYMRFKRDGDRAALKPSILPNAMP